MSLLGRLENKRALEGVVREDGKAYNGQNNKDPYTQLKVELHMKIVDELKDSHLKESGDAELMKTKIGDIVESLLDNSDHRIPKADRQRIAGEIFNEIQAFGPITPLLDDPEITEIMVNGPSRIYVEKGGKIQLTEIFFRDDGHVMNIIDRIVSPLGRRIDESMPMVDARLPDGSRVNAIIPPLSLTGPSITIRKFSADPFKVEDLINFGTLSKEMAEFLDACVKSKLNIVVSGGTGSGKTTTLNVLSSFIQNTDRIITIEDAAELQLRQPHVITLESRPPNIEGKGAITIRDLVRNALRMRPDRIIVGEVRSGEALDMLQAMNTGHDGSLTTGHANSPRDMLARLETMVLMAGMELPVRAIREQISSAIDLIIQQNRMRDGSRRITHITEVQGMEGDIITLQDIFLYEQSGISQEGKVLGRFKSGGIYPKFAEKLETSGYKLGPHIFRMSGFMGV